VLPHALFVAGLTLGNEKYVFLLENTFDGDHFTFVGCKGWYERHKARANFDQQPIETVGTVMMLRAAYDVTKDAKFLKLQRTAFDWFLGANDLRVPLYDFRTKGCSDGLMAGGINSNQGAESTLSFLLSLLETIESYAIIDKIQDWKGPARQGAIAIDPILLDSANAEAASEQEGAAQNEIEETT